jgi:hypothetical protein
MRLDRLMWLCAALFILFGLPLVFVEDSGWQRVCVGLSALSLGCFALAMAGDGLVKGEIRVQFSQIKRTAQPHFFWTAIALVSSTGVVVIITAFWAMFFKTW